jgi:hypothetical protein
MVKNFSLKNQLQVFVKYRLKMNKSNLVDKNREDYHQTLVNFTTHKQKIKQQGQ